MLLHRLPLAAERSGMTPVMPETDPIPRIPVRRAGVLLAVLDLACVLALVWRLHVHLGAGSGGPPGGLLARVSGEALGWLGLAEPTAWLAAGLTGLYGKGAILAGRSLPARALTACAIALGPIAAAAAGWAIYDGISPLYAPAACFAAALCIAARSLAWRLGLAAWLRRGFCIERAIVLSDTAPAARTYAASLDRHCQGRLRTVASLAIPDRSLADFLTWIDHAVAVGDTDQIVVVETREASASARSVIWHLVRSGADVTVVPLVGAPHRVSSEAGVSANLPELDDDDGPGLSGFQNRFKRAVDILVGGCALVACSPVLAAVAIAVAVDSRGPVFFRQERHGYRGRIFRIWKFRTMFTHIGDCAGSKQTSRNDARVTRVGRFLRRTSLDELPQLINVLAGDMSMIGPRPHAVGMLVAGRIPEDLVGDYNLRHDVKPGITGWAQVHGSRGELDSLRTLRRRFALDRHYIENWCFRMDVAIFVRTLALPFVDRHAF